MDDKQETLTGEASASERSELRAWIRSDLARRGMSDPLSDMLARKLEKTLTKLSDEEAAAVLGSVAAAYEETRDDLDPRAAGPDDIADVQRLMQGFREEVQKLDEGLRVLSAYVSRLQKRGTSRVGGALH